MRSFDINPHRWTQEFVEKQVNRERTGLTDEAEDTEDGEGLDEKDQESDEEDKEKDGKSDWDEEEKAEEIDVNEKEQEEEVSDSRTESNSETTKNNIRDQMGDQDQETENLKHNENEPSIEKPVNYEMIELASGRCSSTNEIVLDDSLENDEEVREEDIDDGESLGSEDTEEDIDDDDDEDGDDDNDKDDEDVVIENEGIFRTELLNADKL